MKSVLIFGAGLNQLELIREARKFGVTSVVIDSSVDPPGKADADYFYQVDGRDYNTTKALAIKHKVNGIVTGQMEKPMLLIAKLAAEMGYIFHTQEVVERSLDKGLMKTDFLKNVVPCAKGKLSKKYVNIKEEALRDFSFPIIMKPKDAYSSRGVYKIDSYTANWKPIFMNQGLSTPQERSSLRNFSKAKNTESNQSLTKDKPT